MAFISVTRLRIRSFRYLPLFALYATRTRAQVRVAAGFRRGVLLQDGLWTFWTVTAWDDAASMRAYMTDGAHRRAMPRLMRWCDEASVAHWKQPGGALPLAPEFERRMRSEGRPSRVLHPSTRHQTLDFAPQRSGRVLRLSPV